MGKKLDIVVGLGAGLASYFNTPEIANPAHQILIASTVALSTVAARRVLSGFAATVTDIKDLEDEAMRAGIKLAMRNAVGEVDARRAGKPFERETIASLPESWRLDKQRVINFVIAGACAAGIGVGVHKGMASVTKSFEAESARFAAPKP